MSLKSQAAAICSKCGKQHIVQIHKSINVATDPDLKAEVLSGELFLWECPDCGTKNLMSYDLLYHDPEDKYMVWMLPGGDPQGPQLGAIMNQARAMGDYRLRIVANAGDLLEKVMIFDAGLSDRCIELVKFISTEEMPGVENLHFYRLQDDVMVFSGVHTEGEKAGQMDGFGIGLNVYEDCEGIIARNPSIGRENGFEHIDYRWVESILK